MKELLTNMFSLKPYKRILIDTKLSVEDITKVLSKEITAPRPSLFEQMPITGKWWMGSVSAQGFEIRRVTYSSNGFFIPTIYGKFLPQDSGMRVDIKLIPNPVALVLSIIFGIVLGVGCLFCMGSSIMGYINSLYLFSGAVSILYFLLISYGFGSEAKNAEEFIVGFFKRHETV